MNRNAVVVFSDGKLEVPKEVQEEMHLTEGSRLRLVSSSKTTMQLELEEDPLKNWVPNDTWRTLRGLLRDDPEYDTTKARAEERAWELEHDERKFGPFPKQ